MPSKIYNHPSKKAFRKVLREAHIAPEAVLWNSLKNRQLGVKFRRQSSIGPYFVDFYCPLCRLVIELDGAAHFSETREEYEAKRTKYLEAEGLTVIRFENELLRTDLDGALATIVRHLKKSTKPGHSRTD
jgi:very-short-patch-repair endonuclease